MLLFLHDNDVYETQILQNTTAAFSNVKDITSDARYGKTRSCYN